MPQQSQRELWRDRKEVHLALIGAAGPRARLQDQVPTGHGMCGSETRRLAHPGLVRNRFLSVLNREPDRSGFYDVERRA